MLLGNPTFLFCFFLIINNNVFLLVHVYYITKASYDTITITCRKLFNTMSGVNHKSHDTGRAIVTNESSKMRTFVVLNARVMRGAEWAETETEDVTIVRTVTDQERAVRLVGQLSLCFVEPECTPVPPTLPHTHQKHHYSSVIRLLLVCHGYSDDNPLTPTVAIASECPDVKNYKWRLIPVWHRTLYSCTHMATVDVRGLNERGCILSTLSIKQERQLSQKWSRVRGWSRFWR